jgi:hypothetical protein
MAAEEAARALIESVKPPFATFMPEPELDRFD